MGKLNLASLSEHDDEMFLEAFATGNTSDMTALERDPGLLMGKYEDTFSNGGGDDLFHDGEDVFFGSP
jgi:regulatory protein SWI5